MKSQIMADYTAAQRLFQEGKYSETLEKIAEIKGYIVRFTPLDLLTAQIYFNQARYLSAIATLQKILRELDGEQDEARQYNADIYSRLGSAYHRLGRCAEATEAFLNASRWERAVASKLTECSNALFAANAVSHYQLADHETLRSEYRRLLSDIKPFKKRFYKHKKLRIGYLSADFGLHPMSHFLRPFLKYHDHAAFRLYAYVSKPEKDYDGMTALLLSEADEVRNILALTDEAAARLIYEDEIDLLFDLGGHTKNNRLPVLAYRPATLQLSGLGDVNSTGLADVDYYWTDKNACQDELAAQYLTEKPTSSLRSLICYEPLALMPEVSPPPHEKNGYITFGCFNNFSKVTDIMLLTWGMILERVPGSRLILKHKIFDSQEGREYTKNRLKSLGLDLSRIVFRGFSAAYLTEYGEVDIALDTYPYVGGVTTCEALYMGVPVISLYGGRPGSSVGYSLLKSLGLEELSASTYAAYQAKAAALASDPPILSELRRSLRKRMEASIIMDGPVFMKEVEALYQRLWLKAYAASPPP